MILADIVDRKKDTNEDEAKKKRPSKDKNETWK